MHFANSVVKAAIKVIALGGALFGNFALADTIGPLSLNYARTSAGTMTYSTAASAVQIPGTYNYGNSVVHTDGNVVGTSFGFYDDYIFTVGVGQVNSVTSTIDLAGLLGITALQIRLFSVADASSPTQAY